MRVPAPTRRHALRHGLLLAVWAVARPCTAAAQLLPPVARALAFRSLHTGESVEVAYRLDGRLVPEALREIHWVLRDHRTGEARAIDPRLLDLLARLRAALETDAPIEVISGYRAPATNAWLARTTRGVSRQSLHVRGMAIDLRVPGCELALVRQTALALGGGGVGYYPASGFVHLDVGRVRRW